MTFIAIEDKRKNRGWIIECSIIQIIAINNHTNWLMPIGARECNLNIQHNAVRICVEVQVDSNCVFDIYQQADFFSFVTMSAPSTTASQTDFCDATSRDKVTPEPQSGCDTAISINKLIAV